MSAPTAAAHRSAAALEKARRQAAVANLMANRVTSPTELVSRLAEVFKITASYSTVKRDIREVRDEWRATRDDLGPQAFDQDLHAIDRLMVPLMAVAQGVALPGQDIPDYQDRARATRELVRLFTRRATMIGYDKQPLREIEAAAKAMADNPQRVIIEDGPHPDDFVGIPEDELETYVRVASRLGGTTAPSVGANN